MQVTKKKEDHLKREYQITVPANDIGTAVNQRLTQLSKTVRLPGFRPGKAPLDLVKKNYGQSVMGEVLEAMVEKTSKEAIEKEKLRPALKPRIQIIKFEEGKDLEYKMEFEIYPEVPKVEYGKLKLPQYTVETGEKDVDEAIGRIAEQFKDFAPITDKRASKKGDTVKIDFRGLLEGVAFEGGTAKGVNLTLGSGTFLKDFEEGATGMKAGEEKTIDVTFPADYHNADLAGKKTKFELKVHEILAPKDQPIDDAFAKKLGLKDLATLKEQVKKQLQSEYAQAGRTLQKREMFDQLDRSYPFEVPQQMVDMEIHAIGHQMGVHHHEDGHDHHNPKVSKEEEKYRPLAERRVRLGILLSEIGGLEKLQISPQDISKAVGEQARQFPGQEEKVYQYYREHPEALAEFHGPILEEKVVDFLIGKATLTETKLSAAALQKKLEELEQAEISETTGGSSDKKKKSKKSE
jgi:trigger factor